MQKMRWPKYFFAALAIILPCLLLSCQSGSSRRPHTEAAELNHCAPDVFDVRMETSKGEIIIEVHRDWSPHGADRFFDLIQSGYYDDTRFFRVIQGRWAQFGINGDPNISNTWRARTFPDDPRVVSNTRGTVAFAFALPNGRTTQVFINLKNNSATHDAEFVPFGRIIKGMEVADALNAEYGESSGGGIRGGKQGPLFKEGNAYLQREFPRLDEIVRAKVMDTPLTIALLSKASSTRTNWQFIVNAISDLHEPSSSGDRLKKHFDWWPAKNTNQWVQYDFVQPERVSAVEVYWFDDTGIGECRMPKSWQVLYRENGVWKPVVHASEYGCEGNRYNRTTFDPVETDGLRLDVQLPDHFSSGLLQWKVE